MSDDQEEYQETEDDLLEQFEAYLNQQQSTNKEHTRNILNFQQGIFQLSVDDKGIQQQFSLRVTQEPGKQMLYNTSHNGPICFNNYPELEPLTSEELAASINKESAEIDYELLHQGIKKEVVKRELESLLSTKTTEEFNLSTVNSFSTGFQFNVLNNELSGLTSEMISPIFKNFSSEATFNNNMHQIAEKNSLNDDSEQNYRKGKFQPYDDVASIENDFLDIARQIDTFCQSSSSSRGSKGADNYYKLPKTKNSVEHILDQKKQDMYGKTLAQINTVKANEEATNDQLFDADKAFKAPVSQFETDIVRVNKTKLTNNSKKDISELINNANKRLLIQEAEDFPVPDASQPTSLSVDPSTQFNKIVQEKMKKSNPK